MYPGRAPGAHVGSTPVALPVIAPLGIVAPEAVPAVYLVGALTYPVSIPFGHLEVRARRHPR